jgi:putative ABC transport system permease protein
VLLTELIEGWRIALRAIWANKLRAMLTTLGIIIGIVSVTAMFTTINGIERAFDRSVEMLGVGVLNVDRFPATMENDWWRYINRPAIREDLADTIERQGRSFSAVAAVSYSMQDARYRDRRISNVFVRASTPSLADVNALDLDEGRFFGDPDQRAARYVAVVGQEVAEELFPGESPIGKFIRIGSERFEVIGVLVRQGKFLGLMSFDNQIIVPLESFKRAFGLPPWRPITVQAKVHPEVPLAQAEDELTGIVRAARGLDPLAENDFAINRQDAFREQISGVKIAIYTVGLFLTGLALLVGGIGVMNIMFVSVRERTREIGIRKAVGASRRAILSQFLIEAVLVCCLGGVVGVGLAVFVTYLINLVFTAVLSVGTVILAFAICVGIGVLFGFIPAWRAARSHPIEALRYE